MESTLLLNASYQPIKIIPWERAITLFFLGKVEVVDTYEREVRSISLAVKMPAVVRLLRYIELGRRRPPLTRINLLARDHFKCQYCAVSLAFRDSTVDHVVPRSQGGITSWTNVVAACHGCNRKKGGRTPDQARMDLLTLPIQPEWLPVLTIRFHDRMPQSWLMFLSPFGEKA